MLSNQSNRPSDSKVYAKCKAPLVWTNFIRGSLKTDEELTQLDKVESDGTQFGGIVASSYCPLFSNKTITLCGSGCSPLPNDYETNWKVLYHSAVFTINSLHLAPFVT